MKTFASLLALLVFTSLGTASAEPAPDTFHVTKGDVSLVHVELAPDTPPKVVIYFSKPKLTEFRELILANHGKPVSIYSDGQLVVSPVIESELLNKRPMVTLRFNDVESATRVAALLMPQT